MKKISDERGSSRFIFNFISYNTHRQTEAVLLPKRFFGKDSKPYGRLYDTQMILKIMLHSEQYSELHLMHSSAVSGSKHHATGTSFKTYALHVGSG